MKVLLIRLSSLGDVVLSTTAVEALAAKGGCSVSVLTKPAFAEVFDNNPGVEEVLTWGEDQSPRDMAAVVNAGGFDWIIDLHANLRTRALKPFVRGSWSVYRKGSLRRRLAVKLGMGWLLRSTPHVVERYLGALTTLGVEDELIAPKLYPRRVHVKTARRLLTEAGWEKGLRTVALAPGARWATKAWPKGRWVELTKALAEERGVFPVLIGGPDERELCGEILAHAGVAGAVTAGDTSILETAAVLSLCERLFTNDSATLHISSAVSTPVTAIFGPTVRGFGFYPYGEYDATVQCDEPCRPCSLHGGERCPKDHFNCMEKVTARMVLDTLGDVDG